MITFFIMSAMQNIIFCLRPTVCGSGGRPRAGHSALDAVFRLEIAGRFLLLAKGDIVALQQEKHSTIIRAIHFVFLIYGFHIIN